MSTFLLASCSSTNLICTLPTDDSRVNRGSSRLHSPVACRHHAFNALLNKTHNSGGEFYSRCSGQWKLYLWTQQTVEPYALTWAQPSTRVFILHCANSRQGLRLFVWQFSGRHPSGWLWNASKKLWQSAVPRSSDVTRRPLVVVLSWCDKNVEYPSQPAHWPQLRFNLPGVKTLWMTTSDPAGRHPT